MAVPPAPDGEAVGDPSDSTDTTPTEPVPEGHQGQRGPLWILVAAVRRRARAASLASLVALGRAGWSVDDLVDEQPNPQTRARPGDGRRPQLRHRVLELRTRRPRRPEQDAGLRRAGREVLTAKFATTFEKNVTFAEQTVAQQQVTRVGRGLRRRREPLEDDSARVLVAGTDSISVPEPQRSPTSWLPYPSSTFRYEVDLVRTSRGSGWSTTSAPVGTPRRAGRPRTVPTAPQPAPRAGVTGSEPQPLRPAERRRVGHHRRDPGRLEGRDRRPGPDRPAVPRLQPGRRDAARPGAARRVRRRAR